MKKKYSLLIAAVAILTTVGAHNALAWGGPEHNWKLDPTAAAQRWQEKLSQEANLLGMNIDEYKAAWAQGKSLWEIAKEKGISESDLLAKMQAKRQAQEKEWLQNLVEQKVITQEQADQRLKLMQERSKNMPNKMMRRGHQMMSGSLNLPLN